MNLHNTEDTKSSKPDIPCLPQLNPHYPLAFEATKKANVHDSRSASTDKKAHNAVVIFCDLSNFQCLTEQHGDMMCSGIVETLFVQFDEIATSLQLTPLKANGDQYIAVGFVSKESIAKEALGLKAKHAVEFAVKARNLVSSQLLLVSSLCQLRVGIATGALIAGPSSRSPTGFDIWGTTVNKAAMLEQFTAPSTIAICEKTYRVFVTPADQPHCPFNHGNANVNEYNAALQSDNSITNGSLPLSNCANPLAFYKTQIQTKTTLLSAYIC